VVLMALCLAWTAHGQESQWAPRAGALSAVDPEAIAALDRMSAYLHTLKAFRVQAAIRREDVLADGQKTTADAAVDLLVQRPNHLRLETGAGARHRVFFFDGKSFTIWARPVGFYATVPAPATIGELTDQLEIRYGIELPLADLLFWATKKSNVEELTGATDAGPDQIDGAACERYVFRQRAVDWQLWIQLGEYPLPRRLVLTTTSDSARPQYAATLAWNLAPAFTDAAFAFAAPLDARPIQLVDNNSGGVLIERRRR